MKKTVRDSEVTITELMIPSYANFGGKVHGGILLGLMDKVAYVCATARLVSLSLSICHLVLSHVAPTGLGTFRPYGAMDISPLWGWSPFTPHFLFFTCFSNH